jgi:hypothetical protein
MFRRPEFTFVMVWQHQFKHFLDHIFLISLYCGSYHYAAVLTSYYVAAASHKNHCFNIEALLSTVEATNTLWFSILLEQDPKAVLESQEGLPMDRYHGTPMVPP